MFVRFWRSQYRPIIDADDELSKETGVIHAGIRKTTKDFGLADA
ncbi:MAG: hypothetical protein ACUVQW_01180 [Candidatus Bathycorpusculaceae bacterium]